MTAIGRYITATGRYITATRRIMTATGRYITATCRYMIATGRYMSATGRNITATGHSQTTKLKHFMFTGLAHYGTGAASISLHKANSHDDLWQVEFGNILANSTF
ncbi:hypothetical protein HAZT_HAZT011816 [Hyalella azteca]|uniref:Uncharacterized protein n=1 Tax=Hyalella azteca TaxID=294128 RepID=A0A6A0H2U8_HYAAZ|nr:hypothetical protein HAZT_HAZT011816 [Hyalella azteca]